jgi:MYXO-CTERM domain-containing protein
MGVGGTTAGSAGTGEPCPGGGCGGAPNQGGAGGSSGTAGGPTGNPSGGDAGSTTSGGTTSSSGSHDVVTHAGCSVAGGRNGTSLGVFALLGAAFALTRRRGQRSARR